MNTISGNDAVDIPGVPDPFFFLNLDLILKFAINYFLGSASDSF
jgi:hypothetical protein